MKSKAMFLGAVLFLLYFTTTSVLAQTNLQTGDIAIIGIDTDDEEFVFTTLVDLQAGTEIYFSDEEPSGYNINGSGEGIILYTASADVAAGSVIAYSSAVPEFSHYEGRFTLANSGDGIIAFQNYDPDADSAGTFLFQIGKSSTHLGTPTGLTPNDQLILGSDNGEYNGSRMGNKAAIYSGFNDPANYNTSSTALSPFNLDLFIMSLVWNGSVWSNNIGPTTTDDVLIGGTGNPGNFSCKSLTINSGAVLHIDSSTVITVSGNLVNNGGGLSGNGTLHLNNPNDTISIDEGTIAFEGIIEVVGNTVLQTNDSLKLTASGPDSYGQLTGTGTVVGNVEVQAYINNSGGRYFHLGSPLLDASLVDFNEPGAIMNSSSGANGSVWEWDAGTSNWVAAANGELDSNAERGKAYAIFAGMSGNFGPFLRDSSGTIALSGNISNEDAVVPLQYNHGQNTAVTFAGGSDTSSTEGWNFLANPFAATFDWQQQSNSLPAGMSSAIYTMSGSNFLVYNNGVGSGSSFIAPFQGFFVQLNDSGTTQMTFDADFRNPSGDATLMKTSQLPDGINVKVQTLDKTHYDEFYLGFEPSASTEFDPQWDAHKLMNSPGVPNFYIQYDKVAYAICRLKSGEKRSFPLNLEFAADGALLSISAETSGLQSYSQVILEDMLTGNFTDLYQNRYTFTHDSTFTNPRFYLHFDPVTSGTTDFISESDYAWSDGEVIKIRSMQTPGTEVQIFDVSGRRLASGKISNEISTLSINKSNRMLIMRIGNGPDATVIKLVH